MLYQLLRTSPYLSGQIKHDLILNNNNGELIFDKLNWSPIADEISFDDLHRIDVINNSHCDNIRNFYKKIGDNIFECTSKYVGNKFIYSKQKIDTHDHTYLSGVKRINYSKYNKQFCFLIPMWISEQIDFSKISFKISIKKSGSDFYNIETIAKLSDDVIKYYNEVFKDINDDLINIKMDTGQAFVNGIDVKSGETIMKDASYIMENLLSQERPLLETDYMLLSLLKDNNIIARQLINFNLVFDLLDFTIPEVFVNNELDTFNGIGVDMKVEVIYNNKIIELKDLYTNYEYIPISITDGKQIHYYGEKDKETDTDKNVLSYIGDDTTSDLLYVNKLTQPIFHWSLTENPNFIFNIYEGFAPYIKNEDNEYIRLTGYFQNQGNLTIKKFSLQDNNLQWCKYFDYSNCAIPQIANKLAGEDEVYTDVVINTNKQSIYIGCNKFEVDYVNNNNDYEFCNETIKIKLIKTSAYLSFLENSGFIAFNYEGDTTNSKVYINPDENQVIFTSNSDDELTMGSIREKNINININSSNPEANSKIEVCKSIFNKLKTIFNGYVSPFKINFNKTVVNINKDNIFEPSVMYKVDKNISNFVYRYFGKIIPFFIDVNEKIFKNEDYYYEQFSDNNLNYIKKYNEFILNGYEPYYPQIKLDDSHNFFALRKDDFYSTWDWEFSNILNNRIFNLPTHLEFNIIIENFNDKSQEEITNEIYTEGFEKFFREEFFVDTREEITNEIINQFVKPLYNFSTSFDYYNYNNVNDIIFNIKYNLK
jgi:hypothetical protein